MALPGLCERRVQCPLPLDPAMSEKVDAITLALIGEGTSEEQVTSAAEFAQAQLELLRIRAIRAEMMRDIDLGLAKTHNLRRLVALGNKLNRCAYQASSAYDFSS
jgi:hypothetical protein